MDICNNIVFRLICELVVFTVLMYLGIFLQKRIENSSNRFLNPEEFLPKDELDVLKQLFYLIMMASSFVIIIYTTVFVYNDIWYFVVFDVIISLIFAINLDRSSIKNKILILLFIPYASLAYLLFGLTVVGLVDFVHIVLLIYSIKFYYDNFKRFTEVNSLGLAVILLFIIIFISFFITQFAEHVNPLDSMVMVSNAFTSNGYSVLGRSTPGKINSIFLVWGGYLIASAGTATLTAAVLIRYFNKRLEQLERVINEGSDDNG